MNRRALLAAPALLLVHPLRAQTRTITIVVPFAPGGPTDAIARLMAEAMAPELGQNVVVENATGAGGTIGANKVAQARPDGTTLLLHHVGIASAATLYRRLPYDTLTSFECLGLVTEVPQVITAKPGFPAENLDQLLAVAKREGDKLNLGHSGLGGSDQLAGMLLMREAGAVLTTVAFRGTAQIVPELLAGRIDVYAGQATGLAPFIRDGKLKGYAITTDGRLPDPQLSGIQNTRELGHPDLSMSVWHGFYAPKGTPAELVQRYAQALQAALKTDKVVQRFAELVTTPVPQDRATPAFHKQFLAAEVARWRPIIQAAGAYAD